MTFEEIQKIIEGMLAVQRNIQDADLRLQEKLDRVAEQQLKSDLKLEKLAQNQIESDYKLDRLSDKIDNLTENVSNLNIISQRHEDRLTQSYGYHQTAESDRLRLFEVQNRIERRLDRIERKLDAR
ncbi:MAG: hypothetical protein RLZZ381_2773 [Cyanobacteriota bacterium]|jgi:hypothetical protein